mmetsp:Transcript_15619/g.17568  ORF Transcript_15619/g.17568 Transcript_15619/m.17568 type:complete len:221 (-) Transcript_15619:251-913(-)
MATIKDKASSRKALLVVVVEGVFSSSSSSPPPKNVWTCVNTDKISSFPPTPPGARHKVDNKLKTCDFDRSPTFFIPNSFSHPLTKAGAYFPYKSITITSSLLLPSPSPSPSVSIVVSSPSFSTLIDENFKFVVSELISCVVTASNLVNVSKIPTRQFSSRSLNRCTKAKATHSTDFDFLRTTYCLDHKNPGSCFLVSTTANSARIADRRTFQDSSSSSSS